MVKTLTNMSSSEKEQLLTKANVTIDFNKNSVILNLPLLKLIGNPLFIGIYYKNGSLYITSNGTRRAVVSYAYFGTNNAVLNSKQLINNISQLFGLNGMTGKKSYSVSKVTRNAHYAMLEVKIS